MMNTVPVHLLFSEYQEDGAVSLFYLSEPTMKLTTKIISLFSIIMAVAIALFTSFTQDMTTKGSEEFTRLRFSNMSASISQDIELQIDMMELTLDELTKDTSFAATLNQFIRDDSEDQKMANAAKTPPFRPFTSLLWLSAITV